MAHPSPSHCSYTNHLIAQIGVSNGSKTVPPLRLSALDARRALEVSNCLLILCIKSPSCQSNLLSVLKLFSMMPTPTLMAMRMQLSLVMQS